MCGPPIIQVPLYYSSVNHRFTFPLQLFGDEFTELLDTGGHEDIMSELETHSMIAIEHYFCFADASRRDAFLYHVSDNA